MMILVSKTLLSTQVRAMLINSARTLGGVVDVYVPPTRPPCNAVTGVCPAWVAVTLSLRFPPPSIPPVHPSLPLSLPPSPLKLPPYLSLFPHLSPLPVIFKASFLSLPPFSIFDTVVMWSYECSHHQRSFKHSW